jgi:two-component system sensor histidine kinase MtrB
LTEHPFPARFRRRITLAFIAVAGLSAGALALGAAITVYSYRTNTFAERAREQVRDDVRLLAAGAAPSVVAGRLADAEQPGGPAVIVVVDGEVVSSVETLDLGDVPVEVRDRAAASTGELTEGRAELRSGAALVIGTVDPTTDVEAYFFFPREELERSLRELQITLGVGWMIVVSVAGVAGTVIARRALRPVRNAANAARSVAEGLLDTRLPVQSGDEFGAWASAFNEMVGALEEKIRALAEARDREQRFAADIAHELRTPITAVLATASHLVDQKELPESASEAADIIATAARRLDRLTSELLELHRLEAGRAELQVEEVDLVAAVGNATRAHAWHHLVDLDAHGAVVVETDRRRLDRIVVNLISNAATHGGGRVRVEVRRAGVGAWVIVTDSGPGIPSSELDHVFDRHYKVSSHRSNGSGGSGLGLAIALESAQALGGKLTVASAEGHGATFTLWLPNRAPSPDPASA